MKQSSQHADRFVRPDVVTYGSAIAACASGTHWQQATGPTVVTVGDLWANHCEDCFSFDNRLISRCSEVYFWTYFDYFVYIVELHNVF